MIIDADYSLRPSTPAHSLFYRRRRWCCTAPEIVENNYQAAYVQDVKKVGGETTQAQDKYLAQALWELSERIIKDKVGPDALTSWSR